VLRITSRPILLTIFIAGQGLASPLECLHNGEVIGSNDYASVETGIVACQDPVTKIIVKETEFKNWMVIREKTFKDGTLHKETSFDGIPGQNKYHGWKNTFSEGVPVREELYEHGVPILQRVYFPDGSLKLATAALVNDKSQKSRVEFDRQGNLVAIQCSKAAIGPKQTKWCGLDGNESTVTVYVNGVQNKKLTFLDGHLKIYEHLEGEEIASDVRQSKNQESFESLQVENYSDGGKKFEKHFNLEGKLDGIQRFYAHGSEQFVIEDLYENGSWRESRIFYPNGRTKIHFVWEKIKSGKRFGTYRSFFSEGGLESKGDCYELVSKIWPVSFDALPTFLKHGVSLTWDEEGELREKSNWQDGERQGITEYYFTRSGKNRMTRATYKNGLSEKEMEFAAEERHWKPVSERQLNISKARQSSLNLNTSKSSRR